VPSSCSQKGKIHFLNQHKPVKNCAAEKTVAALKSTTLKTVLEIYPKFYIWTVNYAQTQ